MASSSSDKRTAAEKQSENDTLAIQFEALEPTRLDRLITPSFKEAKTPYVPGKTIRLKELGTVAKEGFITSEEVDRVGGWRSAAAAGDLVFTVVSSPKKSSQGTKSPAAKAGDEEVTDEEVVVFRGRGPARSSRP